MKDSFSVIKNAAGFRLKRLEHCFWTGIDRSSFSSHIAVITSVPHCCGKQKLHFEELHAVLFCDIFAPF
jgi:hypothetical protein